MPGSYFDVHWQYGRKDKFFFESSCLWAQSSALAKEDWVRALVVRARPFSGLWPGFQGERSESRLTCKRKLNQRLF